MSWHPETAMILAAGFGTRMRPLTDTVPKPLVPLAGRALIDHVLDRLAAHDINRAILNVHYLADQIEAHVASRTSPVIEISDERDALLETGGGVVRAGPKFKSDAILIHNSDSVWHEPGNANLQRLFSAWDGARMDTLMLLAPTENALGYHGRGDFHRDGDGRLTRRTDATAAPFVFAGVSIFNTRLLDDAPDGAFSLNVLWDRAVAARRLFGVVMDGTWMHVGDPQSLADAEAALRAAEQTR